MDYWAVNNIYYYPGATWDGSNTYLDGYDWETNPVYNTSIDGDTKYGLSFGLPRRPIIGGFWGYESYSGSRSLACADFSSNVYDNITTRGCNKR